MIRLSLPPTPTTMTRLLLLALTLLLAAPLALAQRMPVTTTSDAARAEFMLGVTALGHVNNAAAVVHFDAALAADPSFAQAHLYRAVATGEDRDEHLRLAAAGRASDGERQLAESYVAGRDGDGDRELTLLTGLAEQFPDDPVLWLWLANTQTGNGDSAAGATAARRGIAADPSFAPLYNTLGYAEMARDDMAAAETAFRDYVRLAPDEANPYDSYGEFLLNAGRLDEAEAQYERALTKNAAYDPDRVGLARVGIAKSDLRFEQAVAAGDADAIAALYVRNAVILPPDSPPIQGRDAIRDYMAGLVASGIRGVDIETVEVIRFDDVAIERADLTITLPGGAVEHGKSLVVWALVDGEWLYVRDMWSMNAPADIASH